MFGFADPTVIQKREKNGVKVPRAGLTNVPIFSLLTGFFRDLSNGGWHNMSKVQRRATIILRLYCTLSERYFLFAYIHKLNDLEER